jgi:WD40 repeat protein
MGMTGVRFAVRALMLVVALRSCSLLAQEPATLARQPTSVTPEFESEGLPSDLEDEKPVASLPVGGGVTKTMCLAYSPDGRTLAVGDGPTRPTCTLPGPGLINENGGLIRLVDTATNRVRLTLKPTKVGRHEYEVRRVAFSPDGQSLVSESRDVSVDRGRTFEVPSFVTWDVTTGRVQNVIQGSTRDPWYRTAISPDARKVAAVAQSGIIIWNVATGQQDRILPERSPRSVVLMFSPDGRILARGDETGSVTLNDVATGKPLARLEGHQRQRKRFAIGVLAFSRDSRLLATAGAFQCESNDVQKAVQVPRTYETVSELRLIDVAGRSERATMSGRNRESFDCLAFSQDGTTLASGGSPGPVDETYSDGMLRIWDTATGAERSTFRTQRQSVLSLAYSPDGKVLAAFDRGAIVLRDAKSGSERAVIPAWNRYPGCNNVAFSPDGKKLVSVDGLLKIWDLSIILAPRDDGGHLYGVTCLSFSHDGRMLASGSLDQTVKLWDMKTRRSRATLRGHRADVLSVAFSPAGETVASADRSGVIKLWSAAPGAEANTIRAHKSPVRAIRYTPDGRTLASVACELGEPLEWRFWDAISTRPKERLDLQGEGPGVLALSPDGRFTALIDPKRGLIIRDFTTGTLHAAIPAGIELQDRKSIDLAVSRGGRFIAALRNDSAVYLWELDDEKPRGEGLLKGNGDSFQLVHRDTIKLADERILSFSPDGALLVTNIDDRLSFWKTSTRELVASVAIDSADINCLIFSPDGKTLAAGRKNADITTWDLDRVLAF